MCVCYIQIQSLLWVIHILLIRKHWNVNLSCINISQTFHMIEYRYCLIKCITFNFMPKGKKETFIIIILSLCKLYWMRKHWQKEAREKQKKITRRKKLLFSSQLTPIHITPEQQSLAEKSKHFDLIRTNKRQIKANITL